MRRSRIRPLATWSGRRARVRPERLSPRTPADDHRRAARSRDHEQEPGRDSEQPTYDEQPERRAPGQRPRACRSTARSPSVPSACRTMPPTWPVGSGPPSQSIRLDADCSSGANVDVDRGGVDGHGVPLGVPGVAEGAARLLVDDGRRLVDHDVDDDGIAFAGLDREALTSATPSAPVVAVSSASELLALPGGDRHRGTLDGQQRHGVGVANGQHGVRLDGRECAGGRGKQAGDDADEQPRRRYRWITRALPE